MNLLEEHIAYLRNNPEGYWFKRKLYGFGWTPARIPGWITLGVYLAFVLSLVLFVEPLTLEANLVSHIIIPILVATCILIAICWRTGEPLRWQWGQRSHK